MKIIPILEKEPLNWSDSNIYLITAFKVKVFCFMLNCETRITKQVFLLNNLNINPNLGGFFRVLFWGGGGEG